MISGKGNGVTLLCQVVVCKYLHVEVLSQVEARVGVDVDFADERIRGSYSVLVIALRNRACDHLPLSGILHL